FQALLASIANLNILFAGAESVPLEPLELLLSGRWAFRRAASAAGAVGSGEAVLLDKHRFRLARGGMQAVRGNRQHPDHRRPRTTRVLALGGEVDDQVDVVLTTLVVDVTRAGRIELADAEGLPRRTSRRGGPAVSVAVGPVEPRGREANGGLLAEQQSGLHLRLDRGVEVRIEPDDHPAVGFHVVDTGHRLEVHKIRDRDRVGHDWRCRRVEGVTPRPGRRRYKRDLASAALAARFGGAGFGSGLGSSDGDATVRDARGRSTGAAIP